MSAAGSDVDTDQLDDEADREELRRRYYGLMQELRVILPGVLPLSVGRGAGSPPVASRRDG